MYEGFPYQESVPSQWSSTHLINVSHTPPWCEEVEGLNFHLFPTKSPVAAFNSLVVSNFVPLSERISFTCPLSAMKQRIAFMHDSASNDGANLMCTAQITKQVNITPYLFKSSSTSPWTLNGGLSGSTLSCGRSANSFPQTECHVTHFAMTLLMAVLVLGIQNSLTHLSSTA